jgi:hypothetical protein
MSTNTSKNDDYRRMQLDDFVGVEDVFMFDSSLEAILYGRKVTEKQDVVDVSVPQVRRSY